MNALSEGIPDFFSPSWGVGHTPVGPLGLLALGHTARNHSAQSHCAHLALFYA